MVEQGDLGSLTRVRISRAGWTFSTSLTADQTNFHSRLGVDRHDRRDAGFKEVHGLDSPIWRLDVLLEGKRHRP